MQHCSGHSPWKGRLLGSVKGCPFPVRKRKVQGAVSASAVPDLFCLTRKALGSLEEPCKVIRFPVNIVRLVTNQDSIHAFQQKAKEVEACTLAEDAESSRCDCIVTRNKKEFIPFGAALYSPEEFLMLIGQKEPSERRGLYGKVYFRGKDEQEGQKENGRRAAQHLGLLTRNQENRQQKAL